jgi:hypothetical protein
MDLYIHINKPPYDQSFIKHYYQSFIKHYYQSFIQGYDQWFLKHYYQSFWYNPHIYSRQIFFTLLIYYIDIQKSVIRLFCNSFVTFHYVSIHTIFFFSHTPTPHYYSLSHTPTPHFLSPFFLLSFFAIIRLIILHV